MFCFCFFSLSGPQGPAGSDGPPGKDGVIGQRVRRRKDQNMTLQKVLILY